MKHPKRPRDPSQLGKLLVDIASGEKEEASPKVSAAAQLGAKGGKARASKFSSCERLTNAFSKKVENHARAVALHMMHYNFRRIHKSLLITPAMAAGVTDHVWSIAEIVSLADAAYARPKTRGPYKKRAAAAN